MGMAAKINQAKCTGCGLCAEACPADAIEIADDKAIVNDECVECGACVEECPNDAIALP